MTDAIPPQGNFDLKEEIRSYWTERSRTYDLSAGHRIAPGAEAEAWANEIARHLGPEPTRILELGCGTGEITGVLHGLGHEVTALDFSEAMLDRARAKHAGKPRLSFVLADAANTMVPDGTYDAVVCRHLVWTLTDPEAAFAEWRRILKPNGLLLIFDGDWARPTTVGRVAMAAIRTLDRILGDDGSHHCGMTDRHEAIMGQLPFGDGLTVPRLQDMLVGVGFNSVRGNTQSRIAVSQRHGAPLRDRLRTLVYRRFVVSALSL